MEHSGTLKTPLKKYIFSWNQYKMGKNIPKFDNVSMFHFSKNALPRDQCKY